MNFREEECKMLRLGKLEIYERVVRYEKLYLCFYHVFYVFCLMFEDCEFVRLVSIAKK